MTRACLGLTGTWWWRTVVVITTGVVLTTTTSCAAVRAAPSQQYQRDVRACDQDPVWGSKLLCWQQAQRAEYNRRQGAIR
jgi:hypothetical protein